MLSRDKIEILERIYVGYLLVGSAASFVALAFGWVTASYWLFMTIIFSFFGLSVLALVGFLAGILFLVIRDAVRFVLNGRSK